MKNINTWLKLLCAVFIVSLSGSAAASQLKASHAEVTTSSPAPNVILRQITYQGSDLPSVDDPLGNNPVSPKDDAGPPNTRGLSFVAGCQTEACIRAEKRWMSPSNWRQDRAMGLSVGWGE